MSQSDFHTEVIILFKDVREFLISYKKFSVTEGHILSVLLNLLNLWICAREKENNTNEFTLLAREFIAKANKILCPHTEEVNL